MVQNFKCVTPKIIGLNDEEFVFQNTNNITIM